MWYKISSMGASTIPPIAQELSNIVIANYKPIDASHCPRCYSRLISHYEQNPTGYEDTKDKAIQNINSLSLSQQEKDTLIQKEEQKIIDLKSKLLCPSCYYLKTGNELGLDINGANDKIGNALADISQKLKDNPELIGNYNKKQDLATKLNEVLDKLNNFMVVPNYYPDHIAGSMTDDGKLSLMPMVENQSFLKLTKILMEHELGHYFSAFKYDTVNSIYHEEDFQNVLRRLLDQWYWNLDIDDSKDYQENYDHILRDLGLDNLDKEKNLDQTFREMTRKLIDLSKKNKNTDDYIDEFGYYLYSTHPTETPTHLLEAQHYFDKEYLDLVYHSKYNNLTKEEYCKYLKSIFSTNNLNEIYKFTSNASLYGGINPSFVYRMLSFQKYEKRDRVQKAIKQLKSIIASKLSDYC
jgi:hypothetical protein